MLSISPWNVKPPHIPSNQIKLNKLISKMTSEGWKGRPILALKYSDTVRALTGSHRIEAARASGLKTIPVLTLDGPWFENVLKADYGLSADLDLDDVLWHVQLTYWGRHRIAMLAKKHGHKKFHDVMMREGKQSRSPVMKPVLNPA